MARLGEVSGKKGKLTTLLNYINSLKWFGLILFVMIFFRPQVIGILNRFTSFKVSVGGAQVEVDSSAPTATTSPNSEKQTPAVFDSAGHQVGATLHQTSYVARPSQSKLEVRVARWISTGGNLFVEFEAINQTGDEIANLIATATLTIGESTFENIHLAFPGNVANGGTVYQISFVTDSADIDESSEMAIDVKSISRYSIVR